VPICEDFGESAGYPISMGSRGIPKGTRSARRLKVFLCHSSEDKPVIRTLHKRLTKSGFRVWFDEKKLVPGQDWQQEIRAAVTSCDVMIVCLSQNLVIGEGWVHQEIKFAVDLVQKYTEKTLFIIPLRLEKIAIPKNLRQWHTANLFDKDGYRKLVQALRTQAKAIGVSKLPRPAGSEWRTMPAGMANQFFPLEGLQNLIKSSGMLERGERFRGGLLIFRTLRQQTWIIATTHNVFCVLDDLDAPKKRKQRTAIRWKQPLKKNLKIKVRAYKKYVGLVDIGERSDWLYSIKLHPNRIELQRKLKNMLAPANTTSARAVQQL
jgi:TIR domain